MGLFNRRKRAKGARASEADRARRAENARRGLTLTASVFVFAGLGLGYLMGVPRLERALAREVVPPASRVIFEWPAGAGATPGETWLPPAVRDELLAAAHLEVDRAPDPFSADGLEHVSAALMRTGWFERVDAVRRGRGGLVRVDATWRAPAAAVRHGSLDYLVSRGGEVLPLAYPRGASGQRAIVGAQMDPPRSGGQIVHGVVWPGADIKAGLELLDLIATRTWRDQIVAVDVSEYLGARRLALLTKWNGRAIWGGAPGDNLPGEVSAEAKLRRLDLLAREFGQVDAKRRVVEVGGPILLVDDTATAAAR